MCVCEHLYVTGSNFLLSQLVLKQKKNLPTLFPSSTLVPDPAWGPM